MADVTPLRIPGEQLPIGHNRPPEPVDMVMVSGDPAIVQARLEREYAPLVKRFIELDLGAKKLPAKVSSEEEATRILNWVGGQCTPLKEEAQKAHTREKKPYLAGAVVDRFFNASIRDRLTLIIKAATDRTGEYRKQKEREQRQREEAERRAADEGKRRAIAEAERLAREAQQKEAAGDRRAAVDLTKEAEEQQTRAAVFEAIVAAPSAPVRLRGDYGATAFSIKKWTFDPIELDLSLLPPGYWTPDLAGIQQAIDEGERDIPGVNIKQVEVERIRRC